MRKIIPAAALLVALIPGFLLCKNRSSQNVMKTTIPIIYSDHYNIRLLGIQHLHPFDTEKYEKVYSYLVNKNIITGNNIIEPQPVTDKDLQVLHSKAYLQSLDDAAVIARIAELGLLKMLPVSLLQSNILKPMRYATGGTILGARLAMEKGWAFNLSGGYHHAKAAAGSGFCYYADIPLAMHMVRKKRGRVRVLIIDLDAHQGNGLASIFRNDKNTFLLDVYNRDVYPNDQFVIKFIDFPIPISSGTGDKEYLKVIEKAVPLAIDKSRPDLIVYNAGTDILKGDPLGRLNISARGIIKRDELVFKNAVKMNIPILMVLSGGYTKKSGPIIGKSIANIIKNIIMKKDL